MDESNAPRREAPKPPRKNWFARWLERLDQRWEAKSRQGSCCGKPDGPQKGSCC